MKVTVSQLRDLIHQYMSDEITLSRFAEILNEQNRKELQHINDLLRSVSSVIERKGENTNWDALRLQVSTLLRDQHRLLYPSINSTVQGCDTRDGEGSNADDNTLNN